MPTFHCKGRGGRTKRIGTSVIRYLEIRDSSSYKSIMVLIGLIELETNSENYIGVNPLFLSIVRP